MEKLRKIRNSAFILDFLLIIAVITAIIGLVTFVKVRVGKNVEPASVQSTLTVSNQRLELLKPTTSDPPAQGNSSQLKGASTNKPDYPCNASCKANNNASANINKNICDEQKKQQLLAEYNRVVNTESNKYKDYSSDIELVSLQYQELLMRMKSTLSDDLARIYCVL